MNLVASYSLFVVCSMVYKCVVSYYLCMLSQPKTPNPPCSHMLQFTLNVGKKTDFVSGGAKENSLMACSTLQSDLIDKARSYARSSLSMQPSHLELNSAPTRCFFHNIIPYPTVGMNALCVPALYLLHPKTI